MAGNEQRRKFRVQLGNLGTAEVMATGAVSAIKATLKAADKVAEAYDISAGTANDHNVVLYEQGGRNQYFKVKLNTEEPKYCDMSALHQNWFADMDMLDEHLESQTFFDKKTRCIYVVKDTGCGIQINEISPSNPNYSRYF